MKEVVKNWHGEWTKEMVGIFDEERGRMLGYAADLATAAFSQT